MDLIRQQLRRRRRHLSTVELLTAERSLAHHARKCYRLLRAQRVLSYTPIDGEISPKHIRVSANAIHYLPRITNFRSREMRFYQATKMTRNRYGILEPAAIGSPLAANELDLIFVPLVAFDRLGNRLGMGGGYYDRALRSIAHQPSTRPYLVGLAHHFQEVNSLTPEAWDVALDAIITDQDFIQV